MATVTRRAWRGRPAFEIRAPTSPLVAVVVEIGGHLAALWDSSDARATNPLWQPHWATADVSASRSGEWGAGPEAALLTNIVGSNLCLDRFGAPHPGEDRPLHGESGIVQWSEGGTSASGASFEAALPMAGLALTRSIALVGDVCTLTTSARTAAGSGSRSVEWCEHTTVGGDFLDGAAVAAAVDACRVMNGDGEGDKEPEEFDVARALAMPTRASPPEGHVRTCRVAPEGSWSISNAALGWALTANFSREDFPFLCLWTEHASRPGPPWGGVEFTRGMEMSTKPFPEGAPPASRAASYLGRPTTCLVGEAGVSKTVRLRWSRL